MRIPLLTSILIAFVVLPGLRAQQIPGGTSTERRSVMLCTFAASHELLVAVSIGYSPAEWRTEYDGMLGQRWNYSRLGKDWWTTFDSATPVDIGGTRIEAGSYYLGTGAGADGGMQLLLFESGTAMKAGLLPWTTALYRGDAKPQYTVPMTFAKDSLKEPAARLEITITASEKDPANGTLSLRWGKHELSAPVKFLPAAAREAEPRGK